MSFIAESDKIDTTHLKAYMSHQNVQNHNPTLFKKINDMCLAHNFEHSMTKDQFVGLFMNDNLLKRNIEKHNMI